MIIGSYDTYCCVCSGNLCDYLRLIGLIDVLAEISAFSLSARKSADPLGWCCLELLVARTFMHLEHFYKVGENRVLLHANNEFILDLIMTAKF